MLQLALVSPTDDFIDVIKGLLNTILNYSLKHGAKLFKILATYR